MNAASVSLLGCFEGFEGRLPMFPFGIDPAPMDDGIVPDGIMPDGIVPDAADHSLSDAEDVAASFLYMDVGKPLPAAVAEPLPAAVAEPAGSPVLAAAQAPQGWVDELLFLEPADLTKYLNAAVPKAMHKVIRKYRRTLKNRTYAKSSRVKRLKKEAEHTRSREMTLASSKRQVQRLTTMLLERGVSQAEINRALGV